MFGFFHVAVFPRLTHVKASELCFSSSMHCILLYRCAIFCWFIQLWMKVWAVSNFCPPWIMLLWAFVLCGRVFIPPEYIPRSWIGKPRGTSISHLLKKCQTVRWLHHFTIPLAIREGSNFSTSSPTLVIICLFDYSHFSGCEPETHCCCDLHFLNE